MEIVFIVNCQAGNGRGEKIRQQILQAQTKQHIMHITQYEGHATALVAQYGRTKKVYLIIAVGGDGTLHEVIQAAVQYKQLCIGAISGGSGNDFGRGFYAFENVQQIEQFEGHHSLQDVGKVVHSAQETYFMNNAGYGIDAAVTYAVNQSTLKQTLNTLKIGKVTYVYKMFETLYKFEPFTVTVEYEGKTEVYENAWVAAVSNQPYIGGGMKISPYSNTQDGRLELTIVHNISRHKIALVFGTIFKGTHLKYKEVKQISAKAFTIKVDRNVVGHADGEYIGEAVVGEAIYFTAQQEAWNLAAPLLD